MVSECDLDIQDILWRVWCQLIILSFWDIYWFVWRMNAIMFNMKRILSSGWWLLGMLIGFPRKISFYVFVSGLMPDIFREEIYSRSCETLVDVMAETRHELSNYCDIIEISDWVKRRKWKKSLRLGCRKPLYPGNQGATPRLLLGLLLQKTRNHQMLGSQWMSRISSV